VGGNTFHGNGQSGGAGAQNYRGYSRGPGGYVAPNGQGVVGGQGGAANGQAHGHFNGGGQVQGGGQFHGNQSANAAIRGGTPGAGRALRGRDQGRGFYNASRFPQQFHAQQRYRVGWNNRPNGWYQRSWVFGDFLPFGWYDQSYYLDFQEYGLPYPPVGCEWVRQGPDAVLVNVWTGEVLSVAGGIFW
jgi:Ni/Co efflux regulator RcnB